MLNMKSESSKIQYVLQYNYGYDDRKHRATIFRLMLIYKNGKLTDRQKLFTNERVLNFITNEMKLYA